MDNRILTYIYYTMVRISMNFMLTAVSFSVFFIYRNIYGLDDIQTGFAIFIGRLFMGVASIFFGYLSDNTKYGIVGKRKSYIVIGLPILIICFFLLFNPFFFINDDKHLFTWFLSTSILFNLFYGFIIIPYQA